MSLLFPIDPGDVAPTKDDWYTPRWVFTAAGVVFDMDVAAPINPAMRTCPAHRYLTPVEDGLTHPWHGLIWCNPPYSNAAPWAERFSRHDSGLILLPAVKRGAGMRRLIQSSHAITLLSADFGRPDGTVGELPYLLLLAARGPVASKALSRVAQADPYTGGAYYVAPGDEAA